MTEFRLDAILAGLAILAILVGFAWRWTPKEKRNLYNFWRYLLLGIGALQMQLMKHYRRLLRRDRPL